jgi:hypothetical protein
VRAIWERSIKGNPRTAGGSGFRAKPYEKVRIALTGVSFGRKLKNVRIELIGWKIVA